MMDRLLNLANKTLIFITHHLSIAKSGDKILESYTYLSLLTKKVW